MRETVLVPVEKLSLSKVLTGLHQEMVTIPTKTETKPILHVEHSHWPHITRKSNMTFITNP